MVQGRWSQTIKKVTNLPPVKYLGAAFQYNLLLLVQKCKWMCWEKSISSFLTILPIEKRVLFCVEHMIKKLVLATVLICLKQICVMFP